MFLNNLLNFYRCLSYVIFIVLAMPTITYAEESVFVSTNIWPPYINAENKPKGSAAKLLDILIEHENNQVDWHYVPYEISYQQVKNKKSTVAFPYFKTVQRQQDVLFSDPVFSVTTKVYFNRQYLTYDKAVQQFKNKQRIGKVGGYSYGSSIDEEVKNAKAYPSEEQALIALFNHEIDVLPMTEGVMNYQLEAHFPLRKQLIMPLKGVKDTSSLHVIASKNSAGQQVISQVNKALSYLRDNNMTSLQAATFLVPAPIDAARLITTEGYPLIIGQSSFKGNSIDHYTLQQGTKVLVIEWSQKIIEPSKTDRIYKNMMDLSKVVLLNGPHVGKELYVRNMHIELM